MADKPKTPMATELIPSMDGGFSGVASAHAPFVFFDSVPTMGHFNGIAHLSLSAMRFTVRIDGSEGAVPIDNVFVAHLRTNAAGLAALKSAIAKIELLAAPVDEASKN